MFIPLLLLSLYSCLNLFTLICAQYDSKLMPAFKIRTALLYEEEVNHKKAWFFRGLFVFFLAIPFLFFLPIVPAGEILLRFNALLMSLAFFFSFNFRMFLNKKRNARWDYISKNSNWYDFVFTKIFGDKGGKAAYIVEFLLIFIGLYFYLHG